MSWRLPSSLGMIAAIMWLVLTSTLWGQTSHPKDKNKAEGAVIKTTWGDPDLQGVWTNDHGVPLERPGNLGDKAFLIR